MSCLKFSDSFWTWLRITLHLVIISYKAIKRYPGCLLEACNRLFLIWINSKAHPVHWAWEYYRDEKSSRMPSAVAKGAQRERREEGLVPQPRRPATPIGDAPFGALSYLSYLALIYFAAVSFHLSHDIWSPAQDSENPQIMPCIRHGLSFLHHTV